jgi:putative tricarboxylic transport membrane protein
MRQRLLAFLTLAAVVPLLALAAEPIKLMVPANPGGGWDATGRSVLAALDAEGIHKAGAQVTNKGGAGGTIGLAEFVSTMKGNDNAMMVMGVIMVGGILTNKSPVSLDQVTPLARLTIEYNAIAVAPGSPFKTVKDFTDALKADAGKVAVGGGSAGGVDHITLALLGQAAGVPAAKLNYVPYQGGGEMIAAVVGGKLAAAISGVSEFKQYVDTGRLRLLGVTSEARLPGVNAPTLKESGVNVVIGNWRGLVGPPACRPVAARPWSGCSTRCINRRPGRTRSRSKGGTTRTSPATRSAASLRRRTSASRASSRRSASSSSRRMSARRDASGRLPVGRPSA